MKNTILYLSLSVLIMGASAFTLVESIKWSLKENYEVKFTSEDPSGIFTELTGDIIFDENNLPASKFNMVVKVASINTGNGMQNSHAKSAKWFDAETYPEIRFASNSITATTKGYDAKGILEIRGIKKEITIPFLFVNNTFKGSFNVNRLDFKIGEAGGGASEVIKVDLSVPVTK